MLITTPLSPPRRISPARLDKGHRAARNYVLRLSECLVSEGFVWNSTLLRSSQPQSLSLFRGLIIHFAPFTAKISFACGDIRNLMNPSAVSRCEVFARSTAVYVRVL